MADSVKTSVINNMLAAIGAIAVGATYSRTVRTTSRNARTIPETPALDAVWVDRTREVKIPLNINVTQVTMTVSLGCMVQEYGDLGAACDALEADIETALAVDITRGGYAMDTRVISSEAVEFETQEPLAGLALEVEVTYRHRDGDPYTSC